MKIKSLTLILIMFISFPVYGISGACSSHGGVNCTAGPTSTGKVICNDGWKESNVSYQFTKLCNSCDSLYNGNSKHLAVNQIKNEIIRVSNLFNTLENSFNKPSGRMTTYGAEVQTQYLNYNYEGVLYDYCSMLDTAVNIQNKYYNYCKRKYSKSNVTFSLNQNSINFLKGYSNSIGFTGLSSSPYYLQNNKFSINSLYNYECSCLPGYIHLNKSCVKK